MVRGRVAGQDRALPSPPRSTAAAACRLRAPRLRPRRAASRRLPAPTSRTMDDYVARSVRRRLRARALTITAMAIAVLRGYGRAGAWRLRLSRPALVRHQRHASSSRSAVCSAAFCRDRRRGARLSEPAGPRHRAVHRGRRARRADAAARPEARREMGPGRHHREPRRRQHPDRHRRRRQERAGRLHADARRRPDLRAQSAALRLAALLDEGVRADHADGVDPAHARGRQQGAGVERQGVDRARQGQARHHHLRHHRPRHHPAHRHRVFLRHRRHQAGPGALQGRQRDHHRDPRPARST